MSNNIVTKCKFNYSFCIFMQKTTKMYMQFCKFMNKNSLRFTSFLLCLNSCVFSLIFAITAFYSTIFD